ncbi:MAG: histidine phosphatase family protein [Prochloraceae cyanobacterium]
MIAKLFVRRGWLATLSMLLSLTGCAAVRLSHSDFQASSEIPGYAEGTTAIISDLTSSEAEVWSRLQHETGYVVLIRHALAPGIGDPSIFQLGDCSTQRNLSEAGRVQAAQIGETFRRYNIAIVRVLSSQWCRCLETAKLMNIGSVETLPALNSFFADRSTQPEQTSQLRQFIINNRRTTGGVVMVTHAVNIAAISGISVSSGGMVVLQADDQEQINLIAQLGAF